MDLNWIEDFEVLAETGNFSRAAAARNVTQPAFSRRIRTLEDWVGTALFERGEQPVALSEAGMHLRPLLVDIVRRVRELREEADACAGGAGTLRFAATHALSFTFFPAWLRQAGDVRAAATIHLVSDGLQACERLMLLGRAEFLLCHFHPDVPSPLVEPDYLSRAVGRDRLCLVGAPSPSGGARFDVNDPAAPRLGYGPGSGLGRILAGVGPKTSPRPVLTSFLAAALRTLARDGRGLAWLPLSLITEDLAEGSLLRSSPVGDDVEVEIRLFRPAALRGRAARQFWSDLPADGLGLPVS